VHHCRQRQRTRHSDFDLWRRSDNGASVALGSRTTTTDSSGFYSFSNIPAGTYPKHHRKFSRLHFRDSQQPGSERRLDYGTKLSLTPGPNNGCFTDTSQADFQAGVPTSLDLTSSPGDVTLLNAATLDQQNLSVTNSGFGFNATNWLARLYSRRHGQLTRAEADRRS